MTVQRVLRSLSIVVVAAGITACANREEKMAQHLRAGDALVEQKKHAEAIIEYKNAVRQDEQSGEARLKLAKSYEATGDIARAVKESVRAADLMPGNHEAQLAAARLLVMTGSFEDGKARAENVLAADPKSVGANMILGFALVGLKDVDGAIKQVEDAVALDPLDGQSQTTLGALQLKKGDTAQAQAAFEEAVRLKPKSIEARISLASFHWVQNRPAKAEEELKAALAIDPKSELVNRALAAFYMQTNRRAEAEPFMKAIAATVGNGRTKMALADFYIGMQRIEDAKPILEGIRADKVVGGLASIRLALIAFTEKRSADAYAIVDGLIQKNIDTAPAHLMKGRFLLADSRVDASIESLRAAVKADPKLASAHYVLGNALATNRDYAGAAEAYRATLELVPAAAGVQLQLARVSLRRGDAATSVSAATSALQKQPANARATVTLAEALLVKGDLTRASVEISKLKAAFPKEARVHVLEGRLFGLEKKNADAAQSFKHALALDPDATDAVVGLISVDLATGDAASAIRRAETLLQTRSPDASTRLLAARAYFAGKQPQKAEELLKAVVQENAGNVAAVALLANIYSQQGRLTEALERYQALSVLEPKSVVAPTTIGIILQTQKRLSEAKKAYERALEIRPDAAVAANNLALILVEEKQDLDRALNLARRAAAALPDDPQISDTIGWIYYQKQLPSLAIAPFERAVSIDPKNPEFQYHLGMAYAATGNNAKARTHLQNALAIDAKFSGATEARGLLSTLGGE